MKTLYRAVLAGAVGLTMANFSVSAYAAGQEIKVGVFNALTGATAFGGVPIQNAMRMALEEANEHGLPGGAKFKIIEADNGSDKGQVINIVNQFATRDNVMLILGPTTSPEALAGVPVANEHKVPMFSIGSANAILEGGPWTYKVQSYADDIMGHMGKLLAEKLQVKRITLVYDQSNEGYIAQTNALRAHLEKEGVKIVSNEPILASDSNFLALSTKVSNQETDAVFMAVHPELAANIIIQMRQAGLDPSVKFAGPSTLSSESFIRTGGTAVEGAYIVSDYSPLNPSELNKEFIEGYKARYKTMPDNWAAMGYTLARLAVQAVRNAGPDPDRERIRQEIGKLNNVPVVIGNGVWSVDENRHPSYGAALLMVKDGAFMLVP